MDVVASLSRGRTAAAQCSLFTHKSVPVIFEPPCTMALLVCNSPLLSHNWLDRRRKDNYLRMFISRIEFKILQLCICYGAARQHLALFILASQLKGK